MGKIMVSVLCITYNQVMYIGEALKGILSQKTDFPYEIIIHDDASTDGTTDIVRKYEKEYPDTVRAVIQKENQFSRGVRITEQLLGMEAKGKYAAFCEGDDYWTDQYKLQKQVDYMERHEGCTLCFHNVKERDMRTGKVKDVWRFDKRVYRGEGSYSAEETIKLKVVPTVSMLFRRKDAMSIPNLYSDKIKYGDMIRTMCLGAKGYSYCMKDTMAVYRTGINNSMMDICTQSLEKYNNRYLGAVETLENIDAYTQGIYNGVLAEAMKEYREKLLVFNEEEVERLASRVKKILIYGAGQYAKWCSICMENKQMSLNGYVVSEKGKKPDNYLGKKVYGLDEICGWKDMGIVIGVSALYRDEIIENLRAKQIDNYCLGIIKM